MTETSFAGPTRQVGVYVGKDAKENYIPCDQFYLQTLAS